MQESEMAASLGLDELLHELQKRLTEVVATRDRMNGLLEAVVTVATGLELDTTLRRIVQAAVELVGARYGALGVLAPTRVSRGSFTSASTSRPGPGWVRRRKAKACSAS